MIKKILYLNAIIVFILLILYNRIVFSGAQKGIELIMCTIVPSIFPFLIISGIFSATNIIRFTGHLLYPIIHKTLGLSSASGYIILIGFFCGYPIASKVCSELVESGQISVNEGNYLLTFINNPSPSFVFTYISGILLHNTSSNTKLAIAIYTPVILTAFIINPFVRKNFNYSSLSLHDNTPDNYIDFEKIFDSSLITMIHISEYVLIFSILCEFIKLIPCRICSIVISALLEITNGTYVIGISTLPYKIRYCAIIFFTSLGGLSASLQVKSVIRCSSLSIKWYIAGKLLSSTLTLLLIMIFL